MSAGGTRRCLLPRLSSESLRLLAKRNILNQSFVLVAGFSTWRRSSTERIQCPSEPDSAPGERAMSLHATHTSRHACLSIIIASERKAGEVKEEEKEGQAGEVKEGWHLLLGAPIRQTPAGNINKSSLETLAAIKDSRSAGGGLTWAEQFLIKRKRLVDLP